MTAAPETFWNKNMKKVMILLGQPLSFGVITDRYVTYRRCLMCLIASSLKAPDKYALMPVRPWLISSSSSSFALVMPTSSWMYRWSRGIWRRCSRLARASSSRPWRSSQGGDSLMKMAPMPRRPTTLLVKDEGMWDGWVQKNLKKSGGGD